MFSKRMFWKRNCTWEVPEKRNYVPGRYGWWNAGSCFYKKFCKEKPSLLKMIFNKTLLICDIYKRNYIYLFKYLLQQRYRDVNQPWWILHPSWVANPIYSLPTPPYTHVAFIKWHSGCLVEYFQKYSYWFRPWYLLARLRGVTPGGLLWGGVLLRRPCELGSFPGQQPVG